jgi:hypothetical protein
MTSNNMSSRGGKPRLRQCPASTKDKPQSGRSPGFRVNALAPPSQFHGHPFFQWHMEQKLAGYSCGNSAGFPPASLLSTLSRRPGACGEVRRVLDGGQGAARLRLMSCFTGALHTPKLRAFGDLPAMFDGKAKALVQRDIMFVGGFQISRKAILIDAV